MSRDYRLYLREARALPLTAQKLERGLVWAICHVHNQVVTGENEYARWAVDGTLPNTLPKLRHRAIADAHAFAHIVNLTAFSRWTLERKLESIVGAIHGLSYAKAAFALTSIGLTDIACIDVHIGRKHGLSKSQAAPRSARRYFATLTAIYGRAHGSGRKQWDEYFKVIRAFRRTSHAPFFQSIGVQTFGQRSLFAEVPA